MESLVLEGIGRGNAIEGRRSRFKQNCGQTFGAGRTDKYQTRGRYKPELPDIVQERKRIRNCMEKLRRTLENPLTADIVKKGTDR